MPTAAAYLEGFMLKYSEDRVSHIGNYIRDTSRNTVRIAIRMADASMADPASATNQAMEGSKSTDMRLSLSQIPNSALIAIPSSARVGGTSKVVKSAMGKPGEFFPSFFMATG
jgi:hypothetical protein